MMKTMIGVSEELDKKVDNMLEKVFGSEEGFDNAFGDMIDEDSTVAEFIGALIGAMFDFDAEFFATPPEGCQREVSGRCLAEDAQRSDREAHCRWRLRHLREHSQVVPL